MNKTQRLILGIVAALGFAIIMRWVFAIDSFSRFFSVMTVTFLVGLPFAVGYITVYLCNLDTVRYKSNAFFIPFIPIVTFFLLTLFLKIEGAACWIMILPVFLILAGLGGLTARYYKLKKEDRINNTYVFIVALLPFLISPLEKMISVIPGKYRAYTEIEIHATKTQIWQNVTRVRAISTAQDSASFTRFLGFPRPIKAELDTAGVGGKREAIFDKGLVFHETVIAYQPLKSMTFTIKANPYEIPSATMDKHIVVGGDFFDVLTGTYELEQIDSHTCRLKLYSNFKLSTTFNFYASIWANWIMKDIQLNILKVIKARAEQKV
ncbi:SRPBCC family protein [Mucilaginibacter polytrichastri]|uniref:Uncharacterized protein n=1 Tax=Mucilaginibacter polytrichastri TaxID=1302689 RepID=A0A1Q6A0V7_9SPHI|nr:hypothetical protein [Mucilaginibacter polytrichastri]OKS87659.1 hypothetical protein RG47T_3121 [Mucilaginibacter polytrichastri]SFT20366.1 hypothetical protein SAMN04487890_116100 [Mucilaginibacter polytrichastri]